MKFIIALLAMTSVAALAADSVNNAATNAAKNVSSGAMPSAGTTALPPGHPPTPPAAAHGAGGHGAAGAADMGKSDAPLSKKGKVLSVLDAKQFTYIEIQDGKEKRWLVSPAITLKPGSTISYADGEVMAKFHSKSLNRDFSNVLFTTRVVADK